MTDLFVIELTVVSVVFIALVDQVRQYNRPTLVIGVVYPAGGVNIRYDTVD